MSDSFEPSLKALNAAWDAYHEDRDPDRRGRLMSALKAAYEIDMREHALSVDNARGRARLFESEALRLAKEINSMRAVRKGFVELLTLFCDELTKMLATLRMAVQNMERSGPET